MFEISGVNLLQRAFISPKTDVSAKNTNYCRVTIGKTTV